jgi:N-acetylglucosaminyldiphosphoundecaprenol N-acetyl-beta-D-mannosaminyltransferase
VAVALTDLHKEIRMNSWMTTHTLAPNSANADAQRIDRKLRLMDITLATLALVLLAIPLSLGWMVGRPRAVRYLGHTQPLFNRWQLDFSDSFLGHVFTGMGMSQWPVLLNILAGDMAWIGPKAVAVDAGQRQCNTAITLRPGLVNIWDLRQRTAVDFGTEYDAELEYIAHRGLRHDFGLLLRAALVAWLPSPHVAKAPNAARVCVGDVFFDNIDMAQAVDQLSRMIDGNTTQQVSFVNPACVNIAAHDRGYRRILARAAMVLPDGIGIKIAADILGLPLKQNVNGTDLFPRLCDMLAHRDASLFLLGGQPGVAERVAREVQAQWPTLRIAGYRDGFFGVAQEGEVAAEVRASGADVLLVARGVPMQDIFIDRQLHQLGVTVAIGVGGLFDFVSGRISRAPSWMRDTGLEWVYRLMQEPSRMWQRYLVGNFTFLGRIMLQRLGFRQRANDTLKDKSLPALSTGQRCVLFATTPAALDIPVPFDFSAALLPFGCSTFLERTLDQLADLGIKQVDLVVSARPEALRQLLAQGERWGIQLRWHLAKDAATPYNVLQSLGLKAADQVLLGHADRWIATEALASMVARGQVLAHTQDTHSVLWAGWGMATAAALGAAPLDCDEVTFGAYLCRQTSQLQVLEAAQFLEPCNAVALLDAQQVALTDDFMRRVPTTWLRTSWGAYSPDAVLQSGAHIEGPALIGPGCFVAQGAHIGAGTVLTRDVVVSTGAVIRHSVVLPQTFVGQQLELDGTVVNAQNVQHLKLGVRTVLPASEGLLLDLHRIAPTGTSWLARTTAAMACLVCLPWLAVDAGVRQARGLPLRWVKQLVVGGRDADTAKVQLQTLRCAPDPAGKHRHLLAHYGAWLDIVSGHRSWFGARPRGLSEWYAIGRDRQQLLANTPVGCLHAPAWSEHNTESTDARAAADVFFAVSQGWPERMRILRICLTSRAILLSHRTK